MSQKAPNMGGRRFRLNFWTGVIIVFAIIAAVFIVYPIAQLFIQSYFP